MTTSHTSPIDKLAQWASRTPNVAALYRRGPREWEPYTWKQYLGQVCAVGDGLIALGLDKGDCAVILSSNRVEWLFAQFGIKIAGGIATPCYATNTADQVAYVVSHSQAPFIFAENGEQLAKLSAKRDELDGLRKVILFDSDGLDAAREQHGDWVMSFDELLALGDDGHAEIREQRRAAIEPEDDAFIIYTSGTTGTPKGVALSHANLVVLGETVLERYPTTHTRSISYLPLCHIAEQTASNLVQLETGGQVYLCSDVTKLKEYLPEIRPTIFFGVPRIWEKVEAGLEAKFAKERLVKRLLISWALRTEGEAFALRRATGKEDDSFSRRLARRLVIDKIKEKLGFTEVLYAVTGAAPINRDTLEFFARLGIQINEAYGLSETTGIATATRPDEIAIGTAGKPLRGVKVEIAEDGEILLQGPGMTRGYLHDDEATAELWEGGWLHTGDVGSFDEDGNLCITDRKKDLIVTAGAKNVAPQMIEAKLKTIPGISQSIVIGDRKPYLIALLTLDEVNAPNVAKEIGAPTSELLALSRDDRFTGYLRGEVDKVNTSLARYETIKHFEVLPADFSIETGELTPTMKIKRRVVTKKYAELIEGVYARPVT